MRAAESEEEQMGMDVYSRLIDALNRRPDAVIPATCSELYVLIEESFTPDEAEIFAVMPSGQTPAKQIALRAGKDSLEIEERLNEMARKGLVTYAVRRRKKVYMPLSLVPGIFGFQFTKGGTGEHEKKLALLFRDFFTAAKSTLTATAKAAAMPCVRVIPGEEEIRASFNILPHERLSTYIDKAGCITVSTCYCRHYADLTGQGCTKHKDVCLSLGDAANFALEQGFGRPVTSQEAKTILRRSREAGLVHITNNTSGRIDFICNCCICHCHILRNMKESRNGFSATSSYIVRVDQDSCQGCKTCLERCPMGAFSMSDDVAERDAEKCIGCGLCVSICPAESLEMVLRPRYRVPPKNNAELLASMLSSRHQA